MAKEIQAVTTTGLTLYAVLINSVGQIWNTAGTPAFEAYNGANWTDYDIALTEAGAGIYLANMPAAAAGAYSYAVYEQAGANPATTDTLKGTGYLEWDGSAVLPLFTMATAASVAALNNLSAAQVNAEVVDALNVDTYAEPGQGAPGATISLAAKIGYIYKSWRNKKTQTATTRSIYNDAGDTVDQKGTDSDDGSTFTKGEIGSGP